YMVVVQLSSLSLHDALPILSVMAVPAIVLAIPRFIVMKEMGIINTYAGLILPLMFDAFGIFLMKQFFEQLPAELEEAAAIDGARDRKSTRLNSSHVKISYAV